MKQFANFSAYGVVASIKHNTEKKFINITLIVNECDNNGLQTSSKKYYVTFFNAAYNSVQTYMKVGDMIHIFESEVNIDFEKGKVYIEVRFSSKIHLISSENHSILLDRRSPEALNI